MQSDQQLESESNIQNTFNKLLGFITYTDKDGDFMPKKQSDIDWDEVFNYFESMDSKII